MDWEVILDNVVSTCIAVAWKILLALLVLVVGKIIISAVLKGFKKSKTAGKMDPMLFTFLYSFIKVGMYCVLLIAIVGILGIATASIITVLGTVGAAIALAMQGSLSNVAAGVMLLIFRPFHVGDYIEVAGKAGTVTEVGFFYTVLTTVDNCIVTVPNSSLTNTVITDYSTADTRRVDLNFSVAYGSDVEAVKALVLEQVAKTENILADPAAFIRLTELGESALVITLRVWCNNADYWGVKFDLTEGVSKHLADNGYVAPFNQLDVHVKND